MTIPVAVRISDTLRLAGALLAAGDWPEREQAAKAYKPHRVAETARRYFAPHRQHPAVQAANDLAASEAGQGPRQLYAGTLAGAWPAGASDHVADFVNAAQPDGLWASTAPAWQQAESDLCEVLAPVDLPGFLAQLFGPLPLRLAVYPNLLFPGRQPVAFAVDGDLVVCLPPPPAWGASPPWRYNERLDEVLAVLATAAAEELFLRLLPAEHAALRRHAPAFALAAAVLFLREAVDRAAGDQLMLMEQKARKLPHLPAVVESLGRVITEQRGGLGDYLGELLQGA